MPRLHLHRPRARGFTLLEIMLAISILAILAAMAIGGLEPMVASLQARHAAVTVLEALARGRAQARAVGRCFAVQVVNGTSLVNAVPTTGIVSGDALVLARWSSPDCETTTTAVGEEFIALPSYATVRVEASSTNPLVWRPTGRTQATAITALDVLGSDGATPAFTVVAAVQGPVCLFPAAAVGACP